MRQHKMLGADTQTHISLSNLVTTVNHTDMERTEGGGVFTPPHWYVGEVGYGEENQQDKDQSNPAETEGNNSVFWREDQECKCRYSN